MNALKNSRIRSIFKILSTQGKAQYGTEAVSQLEHALQCATLAETSNATLELITASLLHDFGHLVHNLGEDPAARGIDDRHEYRALGYLKTIFSDAVTEPIRMHVDAKRYLCAVDKDYWSSLSWASKTSLELQGGIFTQDEAREFISQPYAEDAVRLRIWDDLAKVKGLKTPDVEYFMPAIEKSFTN
ncbi:HD domain-containing protein [Waterburya agarophytonicola K14]|uniref:HD domain-containing protein n=1 Tax=Waterburya agarophytonicola KI4 TaxID=2874699 RepID=A0A964FFM0_9CYAN|nr:phosphonate degradation HD-domain oxygenase [Waterburya agarophytonicola]MCC0177101.1 HD domain-containing protein [Waterburya agarophytonicola KI4]